MKIVAISDTHCRHRSLKIPPADVLLHAGDISNRGDKREVLDFLQWFGNQPHLHKVFIAGNHDFFFEKEKESVIKSLLPPSVHYLKDQEIVVNGLKIWGSPYTPWFYRWAFNKQRGKPLALHWKKIPADADVLLTHGPAFGILDMTMNEQHAGDADLLKVVLEIKPKAHVCGHIHEAYGTVKKAGIKFINACAVDEYYRAVYKPVVFDV